ncbi:hypothetical protein GN109_11410 [Collimonas pratensis]|nr:hypothetical protein [Collimonas pratensis]NKI70030.1 hypothetical protein [Collimonas pratensis]
MIIAASLVVEINIRLVIPWEKLAHVSKHSSLAEAEFNGQKKPAGLAAAG